MYKAKAPGHSEKNMQSYPLPAEEAKTMTVECPILPPRPVITVPERIAYGGVPPPAAGDTMLTRETAQAAMDAMVTRLTAVSKPLMETVAREGFKRLYLDVGTLRLEAHAPDASPCSCSAPGWTMMIGVMMASLPTCVAEYQAEGGKLHFIQGGDHFVNCFATITSEGQAVFVGDELLKLFQVTKRLIVAADEVEAQEHADNEDMQAQEWLAEDPWIPVSSYSPDPRPSYCPLPASWRAGDATPPSRYDEWP